jgi:hypothetical protein
LESCADRLNRPQSLVNSPSWKQPCFCQVKDPVSSPNTMTQILIGQLFRYDENRLSSRLWRKR